MNRRTFIGASAAASAAAFAAEDKTVDGGLAEVTMPGSPERPHPLVPAGSGSFDSFSRKCVGCQLCVEACPHRVLRPSKDLKRFSQPEMGFEYGWCRPGCTKCGEVCPAGAIRKISVGEKRNTHIGHVIWHKERCLAAEEGVECSACERHCPVKAIVRMPINPSDPSSPKVPMIDKAVCIGCGACEHFCPARPLPAMTLKGFAVHRTVRPMSDDDAIAEARSLIAKGACTLVIVQDGVFARREKGRGAPSLLSLLDYAPDKLKGTWLINKTVGRAAAAIALSGGVKRVHALLASEGAVELLKNGGVQVTAEKTVPVILNEKQDGPCPLEDAVKDINDIKAMLKAVRKRIAQLRASSDKASH